MIINGSKERIRELEIYGFNVIQHTIGIIANCYVPLIIAASQFIDHKLADFE